MAFFIDKPVFVGEININYGNMLEYIMIVLLGTFMAYVTHNWINKNMLKTN